MSDNNWMKETYRAGRDVDNYIDDAIRSGDYSALNEHINDALNRAVDAMHDTVFGQEYRTGTRPGSRAWPNSGTGTDNGTWTRMSGGNERAADGSTWGSGAARERTGAGNFAGSTTGDFAGDGPRTAYEQAQDQSRFNQGENYSFGTGHVSIIPSGIPNVQKVVGMVGFIFNLLAAVVMFPIEAGGGVFFAVLAYIFYRIQRSGRKKLKRISQARRTVGIANGRDVVSVDEISSALGLSRSDTKKALQEIIQDGIMSGTVYLDKDGTTLMLSKEAYKQYKTVMADYKKRRNGEKKRSGRGTGVGSAEGSVTGNVNAAGNRDTGNVNAAGSRDTAGENSTESSTPGGEHLREYEKMQEQAKAREKRSARVDAETQKILDEGHAFIAHIHQKNDEIPGEEISAKLDRLEQIVTGIFDQVEKNPESAPDLHKLMSYYLPTTQKLIDTYATLDAQHVQGANIDNAKREIESSLDTINDAYEKLFDSFFQNTAWDVGTDVSVMKSMLQQDGLAEDDLQKMQRKRAAKKQAGQEAAKTGQGTVKVGPLEFGGGVAMQQAPDEEGK